MAHCACNHNILLSPSYLIIRDSFHIFLYRLSFCKGFRYFAGCIRLLCYNKLVHDFQEKGNKFKNFWKTGYFFISKLRSNAFTECVKDPDEMTSTPVLLYSEIFFPLMFPEASNKIIFLFTFFP